MLITRSQFHSKGLDLVVVIVIVIVIVVLVMVVVMLVTVIVTKGHALETTVM
jgi:flagellar basal body-associated protein FliL